MRLEGASDSGGELEFYATSTKKGSIWFGNDAGFNIRVNGSDDAIKINSSKVMAVGGGSPLGTNSGTIQAGGDIQATGSFGTLGTHLQITYTAGSDQELRIFRSNGNRVATFTEAEEFFLGKISSGIGYTGLQVHPNDFVSYTNGSTDTDDRCLVLNRQQCTGAGAMVNFRTQNSNKGVISYNGSAMNYGGTSDYRLKENIKPIENGLNRLNQLNPVSFDWKETGIKSEGFIAHEVQEIFTDAVSGEKNGEHMQQLDYGRITPLLVKAIQELSTQVDELKSRIETLEG